MIVSRWNLFRMRNVSDKSCRENQNTCSIISRKSWHLWDYLGKYSRGREATGDNTIRHCQDARIQVPYWLCTTTVVTRTHVSVISAFSVLFMHVVHLHRLQAKYEWQIKGKYLKYLLIFAGVLNYPSLYCQLLNWMFFPIHFNDFSVILWCYPNKMSHGSVVGMATGFVNKELCFGSW
jgi:hypothetical protein